VNQTPQREQTLRELFTAFTDAPVVYAATCCGRLSLARQPQTRCSTCPTIPQPVEVKNVDELVAWGSTVPWPEPPAAS
jgi:hypothetical protein